jgi:membrane dipeptidase
LADAGVKDVFSMTTGPVMASHANSRTIHEHPRNLTDPVIREIAQRKGWIGLVFEGAFVASPGELSIDKVFRHLDHMLELGAEDVVGFGSDFDGTINSVPGLENAADYKPLTEKVLDRYGTTLGNKILFENFERFLLTNLPSS